VNRLISRPAVVVLACVVSAGVLISVATLAIRAGSSSAGAEVAATQAPATAKEGLWVEAEFSDYNGIDAIVRLRVRAPSGAAESVDAFTPPELILTDGTRFLAAAGEQSRTDAAVQTVYFHNVPAELLSGAKVVVSAVALVAGRGGPVTERRTVQGPWSTSLTFESPAAAVTRALDQSSPYGPGIARLTRVVRGRDATVIYGRYEGLSEAELEALNAFPASLLLADGTEVASTWYQHTTDEAGASFEFRFPAISSEAATLRIALNVPATASGETVDALRKFAGQEFSLELALP
jgi:hypothetical protein